MLEVPLAVVAWVSVVLIQAIVHFRIIPRRRQSLIEASQASLDELDVFDEPSLASTAMDQSDHFDTDVDREKFIELLNQSGSELIRVSGQEQSTQLRLKKVSFFRIDTTLTPSFFCYNRTVNHVNSLNDEPQSNCKSIELFHKTYLSMCMCESVCLCV